MNKVASVLFFLLLITCWTVCSGVSAEENIISLEFSVVPRICILNEKTEHCSERVHLQWKSNRHVSVCLYQGARSSPEHCWKDAAGGELALKLNVNESVAFQLRDCDDEMMVLAATEFKVMRDNKKYRRSRRNPWSFF